MRVFAMFLLLSLTFGCRTSGSSDLASKKEEEPVSEGWRFELFYDQIEDYLKKFHDRRFPYSPNDLRGHFSFKPGSEFDLYGSVDMVYLLWVLDELEARTTPGGRQQWIELIQAFQDPATGHFSMGNNTSHSVEHATAYAAGALKLLGGAPRHEFKWARQIFSSQQSVEAWLEDFNWFQIWKGSHAIGLAAAGLRNPELVSADNRWSDWVVEGLTKRIYEPTGFWQRGVKVPLVDKPPTTIALGGAAHFWWIYQCTNRPIPLPAKAIESTMSLQKRSGLWGNWIFNGDFPQCVDIDATNGMRYGYRDLSDSEKARLRGPILESLERYFLAAKKALDKRGAIADLYKTSHKLPGGILGLAEANAFYKELTGRTKMQTPKQWRPVIPDVCWL